MKFGSRDLLFPIPQVRRLNPLCHLEARIADQAHHQTRDWPASGTYYATGTLVNLTVTLSGGVATVTTTTLPAGSDPITANYLGTTNYGTSSASLTQVVQ